MEYVVAVVGGYLAGSIPSGYWVVRLVAPLVALGAAALWLVAFVAVRYVSVASMVAALSIPMLAFALGESWPVRVLGIAGAAAVLVLHRASLGRLRSGREPRVRLRAVFGR